MNIPTVHSITEQDFKENFVDTGLPVVIKGVVSQWPAYKKWNFEYFKTIGENIKIRTKVGDISKGQTHDYYLKDYVELLEGYEGRQNKGDGQQNVKPPYLHDYPIFHLIPSLVMDVTPFPDYLFPSWYRSNWHKFIQFFMGGTSSLTPLHFDTLYTHNIFFQVVGSKKFTLISADDSKYCYVHNWRWSQVNPSNVNATEFPLFANVKPAVVVIEAGDIIYMPPGTLHCVEGLSFSISFNIDWHTVTSARTGLRSYFRGAPAKNAYYNALILLGLKLNIPSQHILKYYGSYLNYIS